MRFSYENFLEVDARLRTIVAGRRLSAKRKLKRKQAARDPLLEIRRLEKLIASSKEEVRRLKADYYGCLGKYKGLYLCLDFATVATT